MLIKIFYIFCLLPFLGIYGIKNYLNVGIYELWQIISMFALFIRVISIKKIKVDIYSLTFILFEFEIFLTTIYKTGISFGILNITLVISLIYFAILMYFGSPNIVPTLVMMFGFLLLSMAAISIGMFASSITENQIVAAVITAAVLILPWFLPNINTSLEALDLMTNYSKFPAGLLSATEVVGLVSFTIMFIIFTIMVLKRRKAVK